MLLSSGLSTAPCGAPAIGVPLLQAFQDLGLEECLDQLQHPASATRSRTRCISFSCGIVSK